MRWLLPMVLLACGGSASPSGAGANPQALLVQPTGGQSLSIPAPGGTLQLGAYQQSSDPYGYIHEDFFPPEADYGAGSAYILAELIGPDAEPVLDFVETLPLAPMAEKLVLLRDGQVLAERSLSANAPTIQLLRPNGGETWGPSGAQSIWRKPRLHCSAAVSEPIR